MNTYLLAWNPAKYRWGSLEDELRQARGHAASLTWSVGSQRIRPGDRLFLIRLGDEPRGIVGAGWATSVPYVGPHWDPERAERGETVHRINLSFDALYQQPRIAMAQLHASPELREYHWSTQMSGVSIPDRVARALESAWCDALGGCVPGYPDEAVTPELLPEGAATRVYVNRYERNPEARSACLRHYGYACSVCGMTFEERYGDLASEFIQVHHLKPLSDLDGATEIDPIADLRPLCPNCHAVVHLQRPPYTIEQARAMLIVAGQYKRRTVESTE